MNSSILRCLLLVIFLCCSLFGYGQGKVIRPTNQQSRTSIHKTSRNVTISEPDGYINGHGYVDLGLPSGLKWATCNLGASTPSDYGNYYAWGETSTKSSFNENNSLTFGKTTSELESSGIINSEGNLTMTHDASRINWGSTWRMPTKENYEELINNCKWTRTIVNGKRGYLLVGPNKKTIFLPEAGYKIDERHNNAGMAGYIWCATAGNIRLHFDKYSYYNYINVGRLYDGCPIRSVSE